MYPLRGNLQDLSQKRGVEVDVKGWGDVMEGASRRKSLCSLRLRSPQSPIIYPYALPCSSSALHLSASHLPQALGTCINMNPN